ncbi:MAG: tRNA pseudouridine(55) synthase TruB [Candidatus Dormibacteraceae bacterium]
MRAAVLNVNKPAGETSFSVVRQLRELTKAKRVGHAGTLDPLATGVLPLLFGPATKLADYAHQLPKTYAASIHLGATTITDDAEAELQPVADPSALTAEVVNEALKAFVGRIEQQPPAFSAVKVEGQRAYQRARKGELERPAARTVEIHSIELLSFRPGPQAMAEIEVSCASGVYLRSLARDLGEKLGVGGYLGKLIRTAYGELKVADAAALTELASAEQIEQRMQSAEAILPATMTEVRLTVEQETQVRQGRSVRIIPPPPPGALRAHNRSGRLVALGHTDALRHTFVPDKVL